MFADADEMIEQGKFQHRMLHCSNAECAVMETTRRLVMSQVESLRRNSRPTRRNSRPTRARATNAQESRTPDTATFSKP